MIVKQHALACGKVYMPLRELKSDQSIHLVHRILKYLLLRERTSFAFVGSSSPPPLRKTF
jgi:hypothetical protein